MYRRNGKPTSCEPCRISKVRCNHATPVCARCQARGMSQRCFYHPSPMTRPSTRFRHYNVQNDPGHIPEKTPLNRVSKPRVSESEQKKKPDDGQANPELTPSGSLGFLSTLSLCLKSSPDLTPRPSLYRLDDVSSHFTAVKQALGTLAASSRQLEAMITAYYDGSRFTILPRSLIFDPVLSLLRELRQHEGAEAFSEALLERANENLRRSLPPVATDLSMFFLSFTGENIRLEFVGLVFALSGVAWHHAQWRDGLDKTQHTTTMHTASKACMRLFEAYNQANDIAVWTRFMNFVLSSFLFGDTSDILYHIFSEFTAELFIMGFHRLESSPPHLPFFILETRKRIFASAVIWDKGTATFLGRPPRIDSKFCDVAMPLDLDDDEVFLQGTQFEAALKNLDDAGWRRTIGIDDPPRQASFIRLRYQQARLQEKILRLSLGNRNESYSENLLNLYSECQLAMSNIPPQYHYQGSVWHKSSPRFCISLLVVHLAYLYGRFLIERMLLLDGQVPISCLLETSTKLLSDVLDLVEHQRRHAEIRGRFPWLYLYYGLPAAGTLATELLQSTLSGLPLRTSTPRSQIIRDLSVLLGRLERKNLPERPDLSVCVQIGKVIGGVLDEALNKAPLAHRNSFHSEHQQGQFGFLNTAPGSPGEDANPNSLSALPPLPESMTSQDFLSWFDDLVWDDPAMNLGLGVLP
ncbi:uncharacterized protein BJX67DRAFT_389390 [Aspergillus lucknowensis]|uniref:Zn(2)-C6 fungal-type domain-containing protein n=1 Tax=Aspergillus lucknowensis TaxID=176173 RepID=A0ABR4LLH2_9EURO